ncbi:hypothetical protein L249_0509 [Ophiocordyceps polyrhachis-furcata BCC 54312]|uniref:CoA-binding domain-containing protein n=1 Tax=Ophiocordyceps polyrhachis-furcata BCC 54312 TaxID=1330021 RepID=A0A367LE65_9HYPO|nr:hypothetical protein L249_0509 [Ophiocordyceps polyrhachis-furcata BCC 54312]
MPNGIISEYPSQQDAVESATLTIQRRADKSLPMRILLTLTRFLRPHLSKPKRAKKAPIRGSPRLTAPKRVSRSHDVQERKVDDIWVYDMSRKSGDAPITRRIYYFAGGGWQMEASPHHWAFATALVDRLPQTCLTLVSYPLAPENPASVSMPMLMTLYRTLMRQSSAAQERVIIAGDSAGGNIALSLVLWALAESENGQSNVASHPAAIMAISPSTDLRHHDPDMLNVAQQDPMLTIPFVNSTASAWCAGGSQTDGWTADDARICPNLAPVELAQRHNIQINGVIGTWDVLSPEAIKFVDKCRDAGVRGEWLIWDGQMHCFPLASKFRLRESVEALEWIAGVMSKLRISAPFLSYNHSLHPTRGLEQHRLAYKTVLYTAVAVAIQLFNDAAQSASQVTLLVRLPVQRDGHLTLHLIDAALALPCLRCASLSFCLASSTVDLRRTVHQPNFTVMANGLRTAAEALQLCENLPSVDGARLSNIMQTLSDRLDGLERKVDGMEKRMMIRDRNAGVKHWNQSAEHAEDKLKPLLSFQTGEEIDRCPSTVEELGLLDGKHECHFAVSWTFEEAHAGFRADYAHDTNMIVCPRWRWRYVIGLYGGLRSTWYSFDIGTKLQAPLARIIHQHACSSHILLLTEAHVLPRSAYRGRQFVPLSETVYMYWYAGNSRGESSALASAPSSTSMLSRALWRKGPISPRLFSHSSTIDNLRINKDTRVIYQGSRYVQVQPPFTTHQYVEATANARETIDYGTKVMGGVSPGKGGRIHLGLPVFSTVKEASINVPKNPHHREELINSLPSLLLQAMDKTHPHASAVFVPAEFAAQAIMESIEAQVPLVVSVAEHIPVHDMMRVHEMLRTQQRTRLVGPNCPGIIAPGQCRLGIMPFEQYRRGSIGIVSKSGTLSYEAVGATTAAGLGQSLVIAVGGDSMPGTSMVDALHVLFRDGETEGIIVIGEIGGNDELRAAELIGAYRRTAAKPKPVIALVAGQTAPREKTMGHAGARLTSRDVTAAEKADALRRSGAFVVENPGLMGRRMRELLGK